ncbi:uncharacterized protein PGTG_00104 [Puccinia graminis f. sp. tritici CRL 75-36-700-3]|uniref:Uncharacterized protein n=2 Tax=Puccinia graminis f. sp. tritici TaxID=56615 RepID=E3JQ65_PUCGT|nr:uncharacterized protein PGTG_00104 [Puccinia graminis f. sp. tritici CRL 75-36-700-3]EFP74148.2 hypothetical protein PGTG_00104 [Puccinia graminis f. sp. tritici CRL 75-36-700-3]
MTSNDDEGLSRRVYAGRDHVFGPPGSPRSPVPPMFLSEESLLEFRNRRARRGSLAPQQPSEILTLLEIVGCCHQLALAIAATLVFRLWFGLIHHLFRSPERLDKAIHAAVHNLDYRTDNSEFVLAARG